MRLLLGLLLVSNLLFSQAPSINILGGNDTAICGNISLNLTCRLDTTVLGTNSYSVQSIPYAPFPYTTGTLLPIPIDDRWSPVQTLPFTFCFYGQPYTQYVLSTNGIISFNLTYAGAFSPWAFTALIPTAAALFPRSMIGLFHDIDPSIAGTVRYGVTGTFPYRKLVISFSDVAHFQCNTQKSTFQISIHEFTNIIEVHILKKQTCAAWNGGRACLGIQNNAGTLAAFPPGRNTSLYTLNIAEAWRFKPNTPVPPPQWFVNGVLAANGFSLNGTYTAPTTIVAKYQYNCPVMLTSDTLFINELPCCNPINVLLNTN
jgi:hypothetical protein